MGKEFTLTWEAGTEQRERKPQRGNYGEWEFLRGYSTGQITQLLETVGREFKARGLVLEFTARACNPGE